MVTSMILSFIAIILIVFFIFFFPVFDEYLLIASSEIYWFPMSECAIEFFDVVTSDILFSVSSEVSFDDSRKRIDEHVKGFFIFIGESMFFIFSFFLEKSYKSTRALGTYERKCLLSCQLDNHVRHTRQSRHP